VKPVPKGRARDELSRLGDGSGGFQRPDANMDLSEMLRTDITGMDATVTGASTVALSSKGHCNRIMHANGLMTHAAAAPSLLLDQATVIATPVLAGCRLHCIIIPNVGIPSVGIPARI
jgi:hypothetical protein